MNEIFGGWETGDVLTEGWDDAGTFNASTVDPSKDFRLQGGGYAATGFIIGENPQVSKWQKPFRFLREGWHRLKSKCLGSSGATVWEWYEGTTVVGSIRFSGLTQTFDLYRGEDLVASSSSPAFPLNQYFVIDLHLRISDTVGLVEIFVDDDGSYDTPVFTFSGDTKPDTETTFNRVGVGLAASMRLDEYGINSITMLYDGGVGTAASLGDVITGGTSGAQAVVTDDEGDGVTGRLVLEQWDGTPFQDGEPITGGTFDAEVDAPTPAYANGFEANSAALGEGFVVALVPTAPGATTQLTSSTVNANWDNVKQVPVSEVAYNFGSTNGLYDTYVYSDLPTSAVTVLRAATYLWAAKDGTVLNNIKAVLRSGGVDYFGESEPLGTDFSACIQPWTVDPDTDDTWSVGAVNAIQTGPQILT